MPILEKGKMKPLVEQELLKIENLDVELHSSRRSLKTLNKKQRKRFLASLDFSEANEDNIDDIIKKQLQQTKTKKIQKNPKSIIEDWLEEDISPENEPVLLFQEKSSKIKKSKKNKIISNREEVPSKKLKHTPLKNEFVTEKKGKSKEPFNTNSEWNAPLQEGEVEYFVPSKKLLLKKANEALDQDKLLTPKTPKNKLKRFKMSSFSTPSKKKVTIALKQNASQSVAEHIKQVRSSPLNPYDASKLPEKGLLKPNSIPGPINPYFKKLKLSLNDTM